MMGKRIRRLGLPPGVLVGLTIVTAMVVAGFFAPLPFDPVQPNPQAALLPPSGSHWFGTDTNGFDILSRTIASARRDLPLGLVGALASMLVGVPLGLAASVKGPWGERIMRGLDAFQAFPLLVLAIAIVTLTGNRLENVILAILIINVPRFMRLVRSEALALRESRFAEAAIAVGATRTRLMLRHLLPNMTGIVLVQCSLAAAHAIIVIAALSFLGIGVNPPEATWGLMIRAGSQNMTTGQWWTVAFPGLAVFAAVASLNLVADGLSDTLQRGSA